MNRRQFLLVAGPGVGLAGLFPFAGCATPPDPEAGDFDPGPYTVGEEHLVFDENDAAYVLDVHGHQILKLDASGQVVGSFASLGDQHGELNHPVDAIVGADGRVYVLDRGNSRIQVFDRDGNALASLSGAGELGMPHDILIHEGRLYVSDTHNHRVVVLDLDGNALATIGGGDGSDGLNGPRGVAVDHAGNLHVLDSGDAHVHVFDAAGNPVGIYGEFGHDPGQMLHTRSITIDARGLVYVADPAAGFVHVFDESGAFAGRFRPMDDRGAPVPPYRVTVKPDGSLYIWTAGGTLQA